MEQTAYDVFISYRRKGGSEKAQLVKSEIKQRGIEEERIFLDTHSLHDGDFEEKIKVAIGQSRSVVVVISKGCFDEVKETDFWYMEIREALLQKKKVVPIFFDGITSFNALDVPVELKELVKKNAVTYQHEYADAAFDKLLTFIDCNPLQPNNKRKGCLFSMKYRGCLISVTLLSILFLVVFPIVLSTDEDNNDMIAYNTPQESDISPTETSSGTPKVNNSATDRPVSASKLPVNPDTFATKRKKHGFTLQRVETIEAEIKEKNRTKPSRTTEKTNADLACEKDKKVFPVRISYAPGKITEDCKVTVMPYVVDCKTGEKIQTLQKFVYKGIDKLDNNHVFRLDTVVAYRTSIQNTRVDYDVKVENNIGVLFVDKYKGSK